MKNSNDNILSLPPLMPDVGFDHEITQIAIRNSSNAIEDLQAINDHTWRQKLVMDSIAGRTRHGMRRMLELDQYTGTMFYEAAQAIMNINEEGRGSPSEPYCTAFNDRLVKTAARHFYGLLEVGARSIAQEVMRPPQPAQPKSFLKRLLG